jgi:uncharacterized cupredoxin-like copper-binding protein
MKKILTLIVMILALLLTACGNSGPSTKISFTMTDFAFTPNEFTVPAGEEITLHITHDGTVEHNFIIMKYGMDAGEMFDAEDEVNTYWKINVQPDETKTITFVAPEQPGMYQVICGMPGHLQSGMIGKLTVVDSP